MKRICSILALLALIAWSSCKKETLHQPFPPDDVVRPDGSKEPQPAQWTTYTTTNSPLVHEQINALAIDCNDVKWISTANGLMRLQGNNWKLFNLSNTPLPSADIRALAVEPGGTVWVGTDKGVAKFDGSRWTTYNNSNSVLTNNNIKAIVHDAKYHVTWIGTDDGFVKVNANGQWEYLDGPDVILSMAVDHNGALWLGTFNSFAFIGIIKKYDNGQWKSYRLDQLGYASAFPFALAVDDKNSVVAALSGTVVKSVIKFQDNTWQEIDRPENARGFKALALEGDKIWVGGNQLSLFGDKNGPVYQIPETNSPIQCMATDSKGRKWMGTIYGGLAVYGDSVH